MKRQVKRRGAPLTFEASPDVAYVDVETYGVYKADGRGGWRLVSETFLTEAAAVEISRVLRRPGRLVVKKAGSTRRPIASLSPLRDAVQVLQEWTCSVEESRLLASYDFSGVRRNPAGGVEELPLQGRALEVTARLWDQTDRSRPESVATFHLPLDGATDARLVKHLMLEGAYFRWRIGYAWDASGTRRRFTEMLAIEERWTEQDIANARRDAKRTIQKVGWHEPKKVT